MNWHKLILKNWDKYLPLYLESVVWRAKTVNVLERDKYLCDCGRRATSVHHKRYDNIGKEPLSDLIARCDKCYIDVCKLRKEREEIKAVET